MFSSQLIQKLNSDPVISVLTGAGISAESGVPTFRGEDGIWTKLNPEELASMDAFLKNPELVWEWYKHRQKIIKDIEPNAGHYALAALEQHSSRFHLITQNVDGLHDKAGSTDPIELHGNIMRNRCVECVTVFNEIDFSEDSKLPECTNCSGSLRPDVVWFGEMLPEDALSRAEIAVHECDVFFSIGTSAVVHPAASMPIWAKQNGAYLVEINIEETGLSPLSDEVLLGKSGDILPQLLNVINN